MDIRAKAGALSWPPLSSSELVRGCDCRLDGFRMTWNTKKGSVVNPDDRLGCAFQLICWQENTWKYKGKQVTAPITSLPLLFPPPPTVKAVIIIFSSNNSKNWKVNKTWWLPFLILELHQQNPKPLPLPSGSGLHVDCNYERRDDPECNYAIIFIYIK